MLVRRGFITLLLLTALVPFSWSRSNNLPAQPSVTVSTPVVSEPRFAPITLSTIFSGDHSLPAGTDLTQIRTIVVTGDVIPAREVNFQVLTRKDFTYPWLKTVDLLKASDLRVINLESPLIKKCPIIRTGFPFCGDSGHIEGIKFAEIDMVGLENNHITNFGPEGLNETQSLLTTNHITWATRDHLGIKEVRGLKFGLLAFNGIGERIDRDQMVGEIRRARSQVDVLMALFHWGKEYERIPKTDGVIAPDDPREIAHLAIDSGVDLVLGNHPHWFQAVEIYQDHLIPYGHGNFIFDQMWSEETRLGMIGKYTFYKNKLVDASFTPTKIFEYAQPQILQGTEAQAQLELMRQASTDLVKTALP